MKIQSASRSDRGFALVVTISLMILLTVVAVGLLGLSSVALRSAGNGSDQAMARSNARLALILAIGELQRSAGSDRAITAPASIAATANPSGVTGVWKPWDATEALGRDKAKRDAKFTQWLVSTPNGSIPNTLESLPLVSEGAKDSVALLHTGSLGDLKQQSIHLAKTPVKSGAMAWTVIDEGAKARLDLFEDPASKQSWTNVARAGAPTTDGIKHITGWEEFTVGPLEQGKLISLPSATLSGKVPANTVKTANPDLTVYASSLMTNPVNGGLKQDMSLYASRTAGASELKTRLYNSSGVITDANNDADPSLAMLADYHQLYKRLGQRDGSISPGPFEIAPKLPAVFTPASRGFTEPYTDSGGTITVKRVPRPEVMLVPSLVRVDMIFSMITRKAHGGWAGLYGADKYLLHMQYLPVITLHNPYSVPINFEGMRVTFRNLPVGFNFMVDGQDLSTRLVALNQMYVNFAGSDTNSKDFGITLKPAIGSSGRSSLKLEPGQTKLFGMPKVEPTWTWFDEQPGVGADGTNLFDWRSDKTANFAMGPKMLTTSNASAAGFDIDWINPQVLHTAKGREVAAGDRGMVRLLGTESLGVKFGPFAPPAGNGRFGVGIELIRGGTPVKVGAFSVNYGDQANLNRLLAKGTSVRYPQPRSFPATYPKPRVDPPIYTNTIYEEGNRPLRDYVKAKPFMIFSLAAKTTLESFLPSKNLIDGNPTCNLAEIDLTARGGSPDGAAPIELVMMPINPATPAIEENRNAEEGYFFTGNSALNGTPRATLYEIPALPLQSLAQFRHANLASMGFMPFATYTVGESMAHPHIGTDKIERKENRTQFDKGFDHSFLANEALWDRWFLSTAADQSRPLASAKTFTTVLDDFFAGKQPLLNPRFRPFNRGSKETPTDLKSTASGNPGYQKIAAYLTLDGGFNINSTSEAAWSAVLGALRDAEIETVAGMDSGTEGTTPLPRVRRPADKNFDTDALPTRLKRWHGYRRLSDVQIDQLAKEIVTEIRTRGPFLSLSDFVNREVGPEGPTTLKGALQAAIDRTTINDSVKMDGRNLATADVSNDSYKYKSLEAGAGNTASHGPGFVTQGDLLSAIGSRITVRSDTFRIRTYGEARDASGKKVLAKVWCEAVVQRIPDFIDPADAPDKAFASLGTLNARYGRKFEIVSFRWLDEKEV